MLNKPVKNSVKLLSGLLILSVVSAIIVVNAVSLVLHTLYPKEYSDSVEKYAQEYGVDEALLYALIECESGFDKNAVSSVGAKGLTQITPETFKWLQTKTGESYDEEALFEPEISIKYGAFFLGLLLDEFEDTKTALAAYHAGRGQVNKWLVNPEYSADSKKLDNIPFEDTSAYAEKVMKVKYLYVKIYKMEG